MTISSSLDRILAPIDRASGSLWAEEVALPPATERDVAGLLRWVVLVAIVGAVGQGIVHSVNAVLLDFRFGMLNADADQGVFTWASSVATFAAAGAIAMVAAQITRFRFALLGTAAVVAFLSLDDAVALHERITISHIGPIEHAGRILWVACSMPLLAAAFVGMAVLARRAPLGSGRVIMVGLWMLVGAIVLEVTSPIWFALGSDHGGWLYEAEVVIEEGLELASWLLIAGGAAAAALSAAARAAVRPGR
jgi:hypothetical protein